MEEKPKAMPVMVENIPEQLKQGNSFIVWKWEPRNGKWDKPPYNPKTGKLASSSDPNTWVSFSEAFSAYKSGRFDGVGRCFSKSDKLTALDLDQCRLFSGGLSSWAQEIVTSMDSYTEVTPSHCGLRVWLKGEKPGSNSKTGNIEMYDANSVRYLCLTGNIFDTMPRTIEERQLQVDALYHRLFPEERAGGSVKRDSTPSTPAGSFSWDGQIDHLPVSQETRDLIVIKCSYWHSTTPALPQTHGGSRWAPVPGHQHQGRGNGYHDTGTGQARRRDHSSPNCPARAGSTEPGTLVFPVFRSLRPGWQAGAEANPAWKTPTGVLHDGVGLMALGIASKISDHFSPAALCLPCSSDMPLRRSEGRVGDFNAKGANGIALGFRAVEVAMRALHDVV